MLQTRSIEPGTLELLKQLMSMSLFNQFYLVGGTALALQIGHRFSVDLDLFTSEPFDKNQLVEELTSEFDFHLESEGTSMIISYVNEIKVDFVKMSYPILFPTILDEGVRMLDIRDIAPMKLKAITQRGSKKDFYDIYFLLRTFTLDEMLRLFTEKFKQQEVFHVVKSLTYFEDAEQYADPLLFEKNITWSDVKSEVINAVKKLG
ncbi:MAG: nucleotidyl transferase AbiEii/AbiGii toxin family protein [Saprospiraceae bacterium]|nr:nucleotidyl transferase AbiEii/AbiGii toxin family protein [Saprospiraceae bacterium]